MKTRNNDDISIVSRKADAQSKEPKEKPGPVPKTGEKIRISLASKISSSYNRMFIVWISAAVLILVLVVALFDLISVLRNEKPYLDRIKGISDPAAMVNEVKNITDARFVLLDPELRIQASSFENASIGSVFPVSFSTVDGIVNLVLVNRFDLPTGQTYYLLYYHDVTYYLTELAVLGASGVLILVVTFTVVILRGNGVTRKTFGVVDELISKANNISSQNLNLRLNVSDTTDELLDFALTFNKMMDRIEKAYAKQNQFVSDASHELRTPIAVIQGYARMLERWGKEDREILQESIDAINKESVNMQDLVDKLLFIARNDRDTLVLVKEKFSLSELVEELSKETKMLETGHEIRSFVTPDIEMYGDRSRIKQALRIFADNALKYTPGGGVITFRLDLDEGQAVAVIKDTGMGIPEKDLPNIFDRFYRVDEARERNKGGHGLGLSIARIIILRHGGRIKVASKLSEGTRFSIWLPLDQMSEIIEAETPQVTTTPQETTVS